MKKKKKNFYPFEKSVLFWIGSVDVVSCLQLQAVAESEKCPIICHSRTFNKEISIGLANIPGQLDNG